MDLVMLASFADELSKIAGVSPAFKGMKSFSLKPASFKTQSATSATGGLKPVTKMTDYTQVNKAPGMATLGTADAAKSVPTPPVIA
jgi:hypothetical protein